MSAATWYANFDPLATTVTVDKAVLTFLRKWLPTYQSAVSRHNDKPTSWLARPAFYTTLYDEDDEDFLSDKRMPTVFVTSTGFGDFTRTGDGYVSAMCGLRVSVVSRGRNAVEARQQAAMNIAAISELLTNKPALEGIANGVEVVSERPRPVIDPSNRSRHLAAGMGEYMLLIPDIRNIYGGPLIPDAPPPPDPTTPPSDLPTVSSVDIEWAGYPPPSLPEE